MSAAAARCSIVRSSAGSVSYGAPGVRSPGEEAGALARVAGRPGRLDEREQRVAVAVDAQRAQLLHVAARRALVPQLVARAAPVVHLAGGARALERLRVHVRERQDLARPPVLRDARDEAAVVERDGGVVHESGNCRAALTAAAAGHCQQRTVHGPSSTASAAAAGGTAFSCATHGSGPARRVVGAADAGPAALQDSLPAHPGAQELALALARAERREALSLLVAEDRGGRSRRGRRCGAAARRRPRPPGRARRRRARRSPECERLKRMSCADAAAACRARPAAKRSARGSRVGVAREQRAQDAVRVQPSGAPSSARTKRAARSRSAG